MVVGAEIVHHNIPAVLDVQYRCITKGIEEIVDITSAVAAVRVASPVVQQGAREHDEVAAVKLELKSSDAISNASVEPSVIQFVPSIRSGSFSDVGRRKDMQDEHICIDDLSSHLGSLFRCPAPSAFYGVFDGHGNSDAASYIKRHAVGFFFEDANFPEASQADEVFMESVENSVRKSFLLADLALANDCSVKDFSGTTALTALIFGRLLLVANAGDCRAVLCRNGKAVDMSQDHKPTSKAECQRIKQCGGHIDNFGYLNGVLSVTRALGDWDVKRNRDSPSALIAEPEFMQAMLTEDDEFLIMGCDGIWDVMSSEDAVRTVRRGLRRHDNPEQSARDLVREALALRSFDNLTVVVVCFTARGPQLPPRIRCSLSMQALCSLRSCLDDEDGGNQ